MTDLPGHRQPAQHAQVDETLRRIELALCLLATVEDPFDASGAAQQALSRIRVLATQAGVCATNCHRPEELRALLQARKAQYQTAARRTARRALDTAVLPGEVWRVQPAAARNRELDTHGWHEPETPFPDEST